jgi:hypothetical protein
MRIVTVLTILLLLLVPALAQSNVPGAQPQQPEAQPAAPAQPQPAAQPEIPPAAPETAPAREAAAPAAAPAAQPAAAPAEAAAPAPAAPAPAATVAPKTPAQVHIVFYRSKRFAGSALEPSIYIDGKQIARMDNGRYFVVTLPAGPHGIGSDDKSSAINLNAKAGTVYYIRTDIETGFWKGHGKLTMMMPEQGSAEYKKCKYLGAEKQISKDVIVSEETGWSPEKTD